MRQARFLCKARLCDPGLGREAPGLVCIFTAAGLRKISIVQTSETWIRMAAERAN